MKTAFNLIPDIENTGPLHLIVEAGWYGVSFAWYKKDPLSLEGVLSYNFNERITAAELSTHLEYIIEKEPVFSSQPASVSVFYNFKESLLIPGRYFNDMHSGRQLAAIYGEVSDNILRADLIQQEPDIAHTEQVHNIYRIPQEVHTVITRNFPGAAIRHSTSMQLAQNGDADMHCILFHNTVKVILFSRKQLLLVQQFSYKTPEDVVYHLLNTCDKYNVAVTDIVLLLSGMIDAQSNLYQEIYKYFLNVSFEPVSDEVFLSADIKAFPTHFFSHLTALAKCVS